MVIIALLVAPSLCAAQAPPSGQGGPADLAPFLGRWTGQHEECTSGGSCESRSVEMVISHQEGRISVVAMLGPGSAGFQKYSKTTKGTVNKTYTGVIEKGDGVPCLSFTTPSGTKVVLRSQGGKLIGKGTGGRFTVNYRMQKAGI